MQIEPDEMYMVVINLIHKRQNKVDLEIFPDRNVTYIYFIFLVQVVVIVVNFVVGVVLKHICGVYFFSCSD